MVLACGKWMIGQVLQDVRIVDGGVAVRHLDVAPAFERREQHEQVGGAVALVLVIDAGRAPGFIGIGTRVSAMSCLEVSSRQTSGAIGIMGPHIDGEHVLHRGYEGAVGLRRDDPALPAMGFETVFLSVRPIVELLARSTMPSSTTLFSNSRNVQRARPFGGLEQARAISLASFSPSKMRGTAGVARCLRLKTASNPSSTSCLRTR